MSVNTKLNVKRVGIHDILPREINANAMEEDKFDFLVKYMGKAGYVQPIIVVEGESGYTIVDGEHRWRAAKEAGADELDVVVVDLDLREQDIMSINMNMIKGELMPDKFGALLRNIVEGEDSAAAHELSQLIAMEQSEIEAYLRITEEVEEADYSHEGFTPQFITYKFKIPADDQNYFEECFDHIRKKFPVNDDADLLYNLCSYYMRREDIDYED
jgi:ParB/RepB/Spo0J family partition protein